MAKKFDSFEKEPFAAASLGQVHKASFNNQKIVCKLQYPDILSIVEADINQLKLIFSIYKKIDSTINTSEIEKKLLQEYVKSSIISLEHKHMLIFKEIFKNIDYVNVPKVFEQISTKKLLTMNYLDGKKLLTFTKNKKDERKTLAINMFKGMVFTIL